MSCSEIRERMTAVIEGCATSSDESEVEAHVRQCPGCQAERERVERLRGLLFALGSSAPAVDMRDRVMARIAQEHGKARPAPGEPTTGGFWRSFFASRTARLAAAGLTVVAVGVAAGALLNAPSTAWAIEQSIEAMRGFRGLHVTGVLDGKESLDLWLRSGPDPSQMRDLLARVGDVTIRVKDNRTYYHQRESEVVYVDDAQTAGFYPWPGAELLELVRAAGFREVARARDPSTGHGRIAVEASLTTTDGLRSSILEFDTTTKMLVSMRQWPNLDRRGRPSFEASRIVYFEDLPDDVFGARLPEGVEERPKEVRVPEELLGLLAGPQYGISAAGLTENEAARRIVEAIWEAVGSADWSRFRTLVPVAAGWSDDVLSAFCLGVDGRAAVDEVIEVGSASRRGHSRLGPLVVVPTRVRKRGGRIYEEKFIVQFRGPADAPSCVIFSPYGTPYQVP